MLDTDPRSTRYGDKMVEAILAQATDSVDSILKKAEKVAQSAWDELSDAVEATLYPGKHRNKKRNAHYKAAMNELLNKAMAAADAGDFVTAYAVAQAAADLASVPPYKHWLGQISGAAAQLGSEANALKAAYFKKADLQAKKGTGGTFGAGIGLGAVGLGLGALALFMAMRGKR